MSFSLKSCLLWILFLVGGKDSLWAQRNPTLLGNADFISIPFQYSQGFIIIDLTFHQIFPMKFIVDTGAEHTILLNKQIVELLGIPYDKEVKILGADISSGLKAWVIRKIPVQLREGVKVSHDMIVLDEDIMNLGSITGVKIDGILGAEFLKHFIVEIDYKASFIKLYQPDASRYRWKKFEKIPMEIYYNKPYLRTNVGLSSISDTIQRLLLLDTGAALALLLHLEKDSLDKVPSNIMEGVIGKGLGGDMTGYTGMVSFMNIGKTGFQNFMTSFQSLDTLHLRQDKIIRDGILGNFIFDQFYIVFDFPENKLLIKNRYRKQKPLRLDRSGIVLYAFGEHLNQYYVHEVLKDSPGLEADVREGDILKKVGIWPVSLLTISKINKILSGNKKQVSLTFSRNRQTVKVKIILRDLYKLKSQ